jgi:hypothetical protein
MKRSFIASLVLTLGILAGISSPVYATNDSNPAGNNGFVKINNELVPDTIPQNHPHVSCTFKVEFYNYDMNNSHATVNFDLQAPTATNSHSLSVKSGNLNPFIGGDVAGGGNDLDARETYKLQFNGQPHDNQGYHVKLTVSAPGSTGSDKKYKVFWVQPCTETDPQILSDSTTSGTLPAEIPQTGASLVDVFGLSAIAAAAAYSATRLYQRQLRHNQ